MENKSKLPSMQIWEQGSTALISWSLRLLFSQSHFSMIMKFLLKNRQTLIHEFCKKKTAKGWQGNEDIPQQPIRAAMTMVMMSATMPIGVNLLKIFPADSSLAPELYNTAPQSKCEQEEHDGDHFLQRMQGHLLEQARAGKGADKG